MSQADIGLVGLAVMGENLILNMESRGFSVGTRTNRTKTVNGVFLCPVTIRNEKGLHARAASKFVNLVEKFGAEVTMRKGSQTVS